MHIKKLLKNNKGDTIIEVLLSIAVISMVLAVSYALTSKNTHYIQQAQERSEAQSVSQRQLELLRGYLTPDNVDWKDASGTSYKCFNASGQPTINAADCGMGTDGRYKSSITYTPSTATYHVKTHWAALTQTADENLDFYYKLPASALEPIGLEPICNDGIDNDHDSLVDSEDPGCHSDAVASNGASYVPSDADETDPACNDGADNDGDHLTDYLNDPGCANKLDDDEYNPPPINLTITKSTSGGGTVTGSGTNCGSTCTVNDIADGTHITLSATAAANYVFSGWSPSNCNSFIISESTTCRADFVYVPRVPLYRCYDTSTTDHYITVSASVCSPARSAGEPWIWYEGVIGYVPTGGYWPYNYDYVYGGYNPTIGDSFFTTNYDEYVGAHNGGWNWWSGYQNFSLYPGYCPVPGTIPLYRKWHAGVGDHLYTTNYNEAWWYQYEGVAGCLFPNP